MDRRTFAKLTGVALAGSAAGLRLPDEEEGGHEHWFSQGYIVREAEYAPAGTLVVKEAELVQIGFHPVPAPHRTDIVDDRIDDWLGTATIDRVPIYLEHWENALLGYVYPYDRLVEVENTRLTFDQLVDLTKVLGGPAIRPCWRAKDGGHMVCRFSWTT